MSFVNVDGVNIFYETQGQGEPMMLIMGYGHHSLHWGALTKEFAKQYQVITLDNRGVGRSDKPDAPITIAMMADDACKVLDALSISKANVFGVSMGGMIAQEFALNHSDRLLNLILGCTHCGGSHIVIPDESAMKLLFDFEHLKSLTPEQRSMEVFKFFCTEEFIDAHPEAFRHYHKVTNDYVIPNHTFQRQAEAIMKYDTWGRLPQIKAPTMIITGTADRLIPFKNSEILEERIPGAELVLLQEKRHGFFLEGMDSTKIFVNGFLKRHSKK